MTLVTRDALRASASLHMPDIDQGIVIAPDLGPLKVLPMHDVSARTGSTWLRGRDV